MPALGGAKKASLKAGPPGREGAVPLGDTQLPTDNPCLRYEFELRRLGRLGQLELAWQGESVGSCVIPAGSR